MSIQLANIQKQFAAFAGRILEESGGRKLYSKLFDMSAEPGHAEFASGEQPEHHVTGEGIRQICVEKTATNTITNPDLGGTLGNNSPDSWTFATQGTDGTGELISINGTNAQKVSTFDADRAYISQSQSLIEGATYTISLILHKIEGDLTNFAWVPGSGLSAISLAAFSGFDANGEFPQKISYTFVASTSTIFRLGAGTATTINASVRIFSNVQIELGSYPTLFTIGTRPAPNAIITDYLPEAGTIGFVGEVIRNDGIVIFFFDDQSNSSGSIVDRTFISLGNNNFVVQVYGSTGGRIDQANPLDWDNLTFKKVAATISWTTDTLYFSICDELGNLYQYSTAHAINNMTKSIRLGADSQGSRQSSVRIMQFVKYSEVIDTASKAKDFIQYITKGNLDLKAENIIHQNE